MKRLWGGISCFVAITASALGQCEDATRVLLNAEQAQVQLVRVLEQSEMTLEVYERLVEIGGIPQSLVDTLKDTIAETAEAVTEGEAALAAAHAALDGCEAETAATEAEALQALEQAYSKLGLKVTLTQVASSLPSESNLTEEEQQRLRRVGRLIDATNGGDGKSTEQHIDNVAVITGLGDPEFRYQLEQSSDLVTWRTVETPITPVQDELMRWEVVLGSQSGALSRAEVKRRGLTEAPYFRLVVLSEADASDGPVRVRFRR